MTQITSLGGVVLKISGARGPGLTVADMVVLDGKVDLASDFADAADASAAAALADAERAETAAQTALYSLPISISSGPGDDRQRILDGFVASLSTGKPLRLQSGEYVLSAQTRPPAQDATVQVDQGAYTVGQTFDLRNNMPYIPAPVSSVDLVSKTYDEKWNGYKNIFQRASYAKTTVARGGVNAGPAVVAIYGMGDAAAPQSAAWGANFVAYANAIGGVAIGNETDCGPLVDGGIAYNTVLVATGYFQSQNALQIQANRPEGNYKNGIVFNNRSVGAITGTGDPITIDIPAVSGALIYSDLGAASYYLRALGTFAAAEIDLQNFVVGPTYSPAEGAHRRYLRVDPTAGGVYLRARDAGDTATTLYLGSAGTGSVQILTGRAGVGGEVSQVEVKHLASSTDRITLSGGIGDVSIGSAGSSSNSSISLQGKGSAGVKLRDGAGGLKFQATTTGIGFFGVTPVARPTLTAPATDLASTITLLNQIRGILIDYGLAI